MQSGKQAAATFLHHPCQSANPDYIVLTHRCDFIAVDKTFL
jgi:hypothetical protein